MALITLENMRFHAYHGLYPTEQLTGTEYVVDVTVKVDITKAAAADSIEHTVNYETVFHICRLEMEQPRKLIETVVNGIVEKMKNQFSNMQALRVKVRKMYPALGGRVESSWIEETLDFLSGCPRCGRKFINYDSGDCWERFPNLHPATRETLMRQYGGQCLCDECLKFYAG